MVELGRFVAFVLVAASFAAGGAAAQITPSVSTLYANFSDAYYLATGKIEGGATGQVLISDETPQEQLMVLTPPLASAFMLDKGGTVEITAYFSGSAAISGVPVVLVGQISVYTEIRAGTTLIAVGEAQDVVVTPLYTEVKWSVQPLVDEVNPSMGNLEWYIREGGAATGALFYTDTPEGGWSNVVLPVKGTSAPPVVLRPLYEDLTGPSVNLAQQFPNGTNATYIYNWTVESGSFNLAYDAELQSGTVALTITDGEGHEAFAQTLDASGSDEQGLNAAPGAWNITLAYDDFVGNFTLSIEPRLGPPSTSSGPGPTGPTTSGSRPGTSSSGTGGPEATTTSGGKKGSPGFEAVALLGAVSVALAMARRRLNG